MLADFWNARLEDWCVARDSTLAQVNGVEAHYIRAAPAEILTDPDALRRPLSIKNRDVDTGLQADAQVSVDFLQLVRLGLRRADDRLVADSIKVADALLKTDTPHGPVWHRYNSDGYGEHADGSAFDGTGEGRGWPLLGGERGHYALALGEDPMPYLVAMNEMAGNCGLLPEQVWDSVALPEYGLMPGRPTGSAMPLAWAHAEFIKLAASHALGRAFDRPQAVWKRYAGVRPLAKLWVWTPGAPLSRLCSECSLLLLLPRPGIFHVGFDGWSNTDDLASQPFGLGLHGLILTASQLTAHRVLDFTWQWQDAMWAGVDFHIQLVS